MRITISVITVLALAASAAWANTLPAGPAKAETVAASPAPDDPAVDIRPVAQASAEKKPRKSGLDQPLCTGEDHQGAKCASGC